MYGQGAFFEKHKKKEVTGIYEVFRGIGISANKQFTLNEEGTMKERITLIQNFIFMFVFLAALFWGGSSLKAYEVGKTYDKTNWQEIEDYLLNPVKQWIKKGEIVIHTDKLEFEWKITDPQFLEASKKNQGKYDLDSKGNLINKQTGEKYPFVYGLPFPEIDPKDSNAAAKLMDNFKFLQYRLAAYTQCVDQLFTSDTRLERSLIANSWTFNFQGNPNGPFDKSSGFTLQNMVFIQEPYDLRGTTQMKWEYMDDRFDTGFAYLPMLRRVRRMSASARSDPFMGGDSCLDDGNMWNGKNSSMKWKLLGDKTVMVPFMTKEKLRATEHPDGTITREVIPAWKFGYEVPGWQGVAYAPTNAIWGTRPVWLVEGEPLDPYYNYGKQIYTVDKETYTINFKIIYDRAGEYWQTYVSGWGYWMTDSGKDVLAVPTDYIMFNDKMNRSTISRGRTYSGNIGRDVNVPLSLIGPDFFTQSKMIGLSK